MSEGTAAAPPAIPVAGPFFRPHVALVHDYLTQRGGAERVVLTMLEAFPGSPLHTSVYEPARTFSEFAEFDVRSSWLNAVGVIRHRHRTGVLLYPHVFAHTVIDADVTVCSSSGWAHAVRTTGAKIVYCHNVARWLYQTDDYLGRRAVGARLVFAPVRASLIPWDKHAAASADVYIANSTCVRDRIRRVYGIDASVLPPPPAVDATGPLHPVGGLDPGFLLCVCRLLKYKHVPAVVEATRRRGDRLVIVGKGPEERAIRRALHPRATLLTGVDDPSLRWLYSNCRAVVSAASEDYGLTPLEGGLFGAPCAVLRGGGFLDTVRELRTGVFFDEPTPEAIGNGLRVLDHTRWDEHEIRAHAEAFGKPRFIERLRAIVDAAAAPRLTGRLEVVRR